MRVAVLPPLYPPRSRVGAWLATHQLVTGLAQRGHDVRVAPTLMAVGRTYRLDGVTVTPGRNRQQAVAGADVVIAHAGASRDALRGLTIRAPIVRLVHGPEVLPRTIADAALVVANAHATAAAVGPHVPRGATLAVVHPPTFPALYRTAPGQEVTLVNLAPEKGGDLFWAIARRLPHVRFLAVRGGYGRQVVHSRPNVSVIGPVSNMRLEVYSRTRLLLMPSRAETWGMVGVEAMCSGIPVLARPTPGLRESLGRAGNFLACDDPDAWAAEVSRLLSSRAWHGASLRARARIRELDPAGEVARFADAVEALAP